MSRRHFNLERPAPYLYGTLQPRDTYGTPAPFLMPDTVATAARTHTRAGRRASIQALDAKQAAALEKDMWAPSASRVRTHLYRCDCHCYYTLLHSVRVRMCSDAQPVWMCTRTSA